MEEYKKSEIAVLQIKAAITLLKSGNFVSALTLAGAGNEILSKLCRARNLPWTHTFESNLVVNIDTLTPKKLARLVDQNIHKTRGLIKHHSTTKSEDEPVKADFFLERGR